MEDPSVSVVTTAPNGTVQGIDHDNENILQYAKVNSLVLIVVKHLEVTTLAPPALLATVQMLQHRNL